MENRPGAESPYIRVQDLSFSYGDRPVLQGASLDVNPAELVALVGPNGSGKSTLIRLLTRILPAHSGQVEIGGTRLRDLDPAPLARRVAVVSQGTGIDFDFSVFEVVMMGRSPHLGAWGRESARDREIVRDALALTDTLPLAERSIRQISGGERQRVMVARALAQQPEALLLDEPTAHLDINHQADLLELVLRLCRERRIAVLAVLHDLNLAATYADRVLMLHEGKIASSGSPEEVLTAGRIHEVFGAHVLITRHPTTDRPVVLIRPRVLAGD